MGHVLDGYSEHMGEMPDDRTFLLADAPEPDKAEIVEALRETETEVLLNYLPVGSQQATEFYAECALEPVSPSSTTSPSSLPSDETWAKRFAEAGVPLIGDDIKAQLGATIVHRVLTDLFAKRGVKLDRTYQLNTGGNTDFLNMTNRTRLKSKKISKTKPSSPSPSTASTMRTSTSARPITSPGRTTTRSASCAWKANCSAACP
jgi:myo-inositol-1-phosphate synthase